MGFYNPNRKLDVNPAAIKQLDIPNPRSASTAATYRRALDPNSGLFKNIAKSVGYTGELTKGQIDEVTQVAFAYRYVDGITNAIGGQKALLTSLAEKVSKATNKQDIYKIVAGNLQIKYSSIQDYVYTYNRGFSDALSYKKLKANEVWQSTYAKLVDDVETARAADPSLMSKAELEDFRTKLADDFDEQARLSGDNSIRKALDDGTFFTDNRLCKSCDNVKGASKTLLDDEVFDDLIGACKAN